MQEWRKSSVLRPGDWLRSEIWRQGTAERTGNASSISGGEPTVHHRVANVPPPISLERWSIKYGLRERRTALADWNSASYPYSASVVLALDPAPRPDAGQTKNAARLKSCLLAEASPSLPPACYIKRFGFLD